MGEHVMRTNVLESIPYSAKNPSTSFLAFTTTFGLIATGRVFAYYSIIHEYYRRAA